MYDNVNLVTVFDRDFISVGPYQDNLSMMLFRDESLFLVEGGYYSGKQRINLSATDDDGTTTVSANLIVLDHIWDKINVKNTIGTIEILASTQQIYTFNEEDIIDGNGLNIKVKTSNEKLLKGVGTTQAPVRVTWTTGDRQGSYYFAHNKAILVDKANTANLGNCIDKSSPPITILCTQIASDAVGQGYKFNDKIIAERNITVGYSNNVDKGASNIHIFTDEGLVQTVNIKQTITDIAFMSSNTYFYVFMSYGNTVEIRSLNPNDITEFVTYKVINKASLGVE